MPSPTEAALTEILREFGLPACNEDVVAAYLASRGAFVRNLSVDAEAVSVVQEIVDRLPLPEHLTGYGTVYRLTLRADTVARLERLARGEAAA
jgi:hypothetical protein